MAKVLNPNQDLKINAGLMQMWKKAGLRVKSFKATKKGHNEIWSGEFKTKNATLSMSVDKYGSVFYHAGNKSVNIGRLDKQSKIIEWMKAIIKNSPWSESVNEAFGDLNDSGFEKVRKYNKIVIKLVKKLENSVRHSEGKDAVKWIRGLYDAVGIMYDTIGHKMYYESINEKVARPMSYRLRKAQDEIEYMITQGPLDDEGVYDKPGQAMKLLQTAQKALGKIK